MRNTENNDAKDERQRLCHCSKKIVQVDEAEEISDKDDARRRTSQSVFARVLL